MTTPPELAAMATVAEVLGPFRRAAAGGRIMAWLGAWMSTFPEDDEELPPPLSAPVAKVAARAKESQSLKIVGETVDIPPTWRPESVRLSIVPRETITPLIISEPRQEVEYIPPATVAACEHRKKPSACPTCTLKKATLAAADRMMAEAAARLPEPPESRLVKGAITLGEEAARAYEHEWRVKAAKTKNSQTKAEKKAAHLLEQPPRTRLTARMPARNPKKEPEWERDTLLPAIAGLIEAEGEPLRVGELIDLLDKRHGITITGEKPYLTLMATLHRCDKYSNGANGWWPKGRPLPT